MSANEDPLNDDVATWAFKESLTNLAAAVQTNKQANMAAQQHAQQQAMQSQQLAAAVQSMT